MSELASSIRDKISQTQKDINSARNKAEEYRRKATEHEQKEKELQSFLLHLREWLSQIEGSTPLSDYENEHIFKRGIRPLILTYLEGHTAFTGAELISAITFQNPLIKPASIRSTLSRIKDEGLIIREGNDRYLTTSHLDPAHIFPRQTNIIDDAEDIGAEPVPFE